MKINIIVTYSDKYIIGNNNNKLWDYSENNEYINTLLSEQKSAAIFGYNAYLSKYYNINNDFIKIIITSKKLYNNIDNNIFFVDSLGSSIELCNKLYLNDIYIIGGDEIYSYFLKSYYYKFLDKVYITRINKNYEGNKYFYGLEEKFYYINVTQSIQYPELEYRILQYDCDFINPEMKYLIELRDIKNNFKLDINLSQYFPIFSLIKDKKDEILTKIFNSLKNIKYNKTLNLTGIQPYDSIYNFNDENGCLSCDVIHNTGNMMTDVLCNIIFSSLFTIFMSQILKLKAYKLTYKCINNYILESDSHIIDKIAWNIPDVLPIIIIKNRDQQTLQDFEINDLQFLGFKI